jgi:putative transposase
MARAYSNDLRERVVAAVELDGMSCREAAAQFSVGVSTAIRWLARYRGSGSVAPAQIGGYRPKSIAGAHRDWLIERCRGSTFTLRGLVAELVERGLKVDYRTMWSFVHAERLSFKKNRAGCRTGSPRRRAPSGAVASVSAAD